MAAICYDRILQKVWSQFLLYLILADHVQVDDAPVHSRCAILNRFMEELKHGI